MTEHPEIKTEVELLKQEVGMISKIMAKFDTTIDKLQQVANDLSRVVLIQEQKMIQQDKINDETGRILERQDKEHTEELKELKKKFDEFEDKIIDKLNGLESWRYMIMTIISIVTFFVATFASTFIKWLFGSG
jgi:prefoldin subunit 5